ncbi:MAG: right-handed parallel beta-helix repeat-containing protein, partial [Verrucomicrobiae bacterium]|nr:right-handed parallel beta-helix repeat-containing protein [Verrucomicrobiae bacterium]
AHCVFERCEFVHLGSSAVSIEGKSEGNRISGCHVYDVGGNGIMVGEPVNKSELLCRNNFIANNFIHDCGVISHGCVGIWVGLTGETVVAHNELCRLPYTGISVGWQWDANPTQCAKNIVESNHVHDVMQMLSDGGGIYTLGRQPGTVLRGNLIHNIPPNSGRADSNGIFMDEGSSEILVENNTIHNVAKSPIRFHKAALLRIRRNTLLVAAGLESFTFNNCDAKEMTFEENLIRLIPREGP